MPTKCSVKGCDSYYSKGNSFFNLPTPLKYKYSREKASMSKKRRKRWLEAMRMQDDASKVLRICSKHFKKGKPAALEETRDADWVPTLAMNLPELAVDKEETGKGVASRVRNSRNASKERNNIHKRADLKRYLNCKVLLDRKLRGSTFSGTNGSGLAVSQKHGTFTSDNVTLSETAINNTVLRIHLVRDDIDSLKKSYSSGEFTPTNRRKRKLQQVSSFGREIKKKRFFLDYDYYEQASQKKQNVSLNSKLPEKAKTNVAQMESPQMRKLTMKELKPSIHRRLQSKPATVKSASDNSKTLNRTIRKPDKDKIKIKLFTKSPTPSRRVVRNGTITKPDDDSLKLHREILFVRQYKNECVWSKSDKSYYLKYPLYRYHEDGRLEYSFQKLVTDVKHMKLPGPTWKIKVIIRQGKISAITFTNKLMLERCVGFSATSDRYIIILDNRPAMLLGSPGAVANSSELEILLDIVENIEPKDPMIFYK